jgi:hypothetical protein
MAGFRAGLTVFVSRFPQKASIHPLTRSSRAYFEGCSNFSFCYSPFFIFDFFPPERFETAVFRPVFRAVVFVEIDRRCKNNDILPGNIEKTGKIF